MIFIAHGVRFRGRPSATARGVLLVLASMLLTAGCATAEAPTGSAPSAAAEATGIVVDVDSRSPAEISAFTIRTERGETLVFEIEASDPPGGEFPPSHLRDHLAAAEPIRVVYRVEGDRRIATELADAVPAASSAPPVAGSPSAPVTRSPAAPSGTATASPGRTFTASPGPTPTATQEEAFRPGRVRLELVDFLDGLESPLFLTHAGDGTGRLYVVEQGGRIRLVESDGALRERPFLDITDRVTAGGERGLLGLAFHPAYESNGRFFVNYTDQNGDTHISEFRAPREGNADPGSERVLLAIDQPYPNHNGGMIAFGPDGYLYIGMGDGGSGGDPHDNGQRLDTLLGKMLRIDVHAEGERPYTVPADNPYRERGDARPEIWASGLRNPWRWSFDRETGDMFIGDVGQSAREEISVGPAGEGGRNYGWRIMEGDQCFEPEDCDPAGFVQPAVAYPRDQGSIVIGGYVYRGSEHPALRGGYLFADTVSGRIWAFRASDGVRGGAVEYRELLVADGLSIVSFGEDEAGELYVVDLGGTVKRVRASGL